MQKFKCTNELRHVYTCYIASTYVQYICMYVNCTYISMYLSEHVFSYLFYVARLRLTYVLSLLHSLTNTEYSFAYWHRYSSVEEMNNPLITQCKYLVTNLVYYFMEGFLERRGILQKLCMWHYVGPFFVFCSYDSSVVVVIRVESIRECVFINRASTRCKLETKWA